jgi:hypothetical protein
MGSIGKTIRALSAQIRRGRRTDNEVRLKAKKAAEKSGGKNAVVKVAGAYMRGARVESELFNSF